MFVRICIQDQKLDSDNLMGYLGSGALSGKILPVRIIANNKINAYCGQVRLNKGQLYPALLGKGLG